MHMDIERQGSAESLRQRLTEAASRPGTASLLVLAGASSLGDPEDWNALLPTLPIPAFGGFFPGVIVRDERLEHGAVVISLPRRPDFILIEALSEPATDFDDLFGTQLPTGRAPTAIALVDGWSRRIDDFIETMFNHLGMDTGFIGGGAGTLDRGIATPLITPWGLKGDSALLALLDLPSGVGALHGWSPIAGPFEVTEAHDNTLISLDWRPALDVYREIVEPHAGQALEPGRFFETAKAYPFGMARLDAEFVVRDPIQIEEDSGLRCVGSIPAGALVHILHGHPDELPAAARQARLLAVHRLPEDVRPALDLFMDCISRALFLGDRFGDELRAVQPPDHPLAGALTLGEIAGHGRSYLEFHNKTAVLATLGTPS